MGMTQIQHMEPATWKSIDQYDTDLKTKAQMCEFAQLKDSLIRDRIVCGIICDKTCTRLLKESELTLQNALNICAANEATSSQLKPSVLTPPVKKHIRKSLSSRNDVTVITPNLNVTNVGINTIATNLVQHKVWNVTTVVEETISLKYVEAVLLQSTTRKLTVLHNVIALIPLMISSLVWYNVAPINHLIGK